MPLRVGGGTRLKIYEAMAMGVPVVSTTIGAEGLPLRNGEHLLIADTPDAQVERNLRAPHGSDTGRSARGSSTPVRAGALQLGCGRGAFPFPMSPPGCGARVVVSGSDRLTAGPRWLRPNS